MPRTTGKFIAVILAIWLPLFSGNALAMSVVMQLMSGGHSVAAGQEHACCDPAGQEHAHHAAADQHQPAGHQDSTGDECGTCHLACSGYLATAALEVTGGPSPAMLFQPVSARFHSFTPAPLDPPPLARA